MPANVITCINVMAKNNPRDLDFQDRHERPSPMDKPGESIDTPAGAAADRSFIPDHMLIGVRDHPPSDADCINDSVNTNHGNAFGVLPSPNLTGVAGDPSDGDTAGVNVENNDENNDDNEANSDTLSGSPYLPPDTASEEEDEEDRDKPYSSDDDDNPSQPLPPS